MVGDLFIFNFSFKDKLRKDIITSSEAESNVFSQ